MGKRECILGEKKWKKKVKKKSGVELLEGDAYGTFSGCSQYEAQHRSALCIPPPPPAARSPLDKREIQAGINLLGKQAGAAESIAARCHGAVAQRGGLAATAAPPGVSGSTGDVWLGAPAVAWGGYTYLEQHRAVLRSCKEFGEQSCSAAELLPKCSKKGGRERF